MEYGTIKIERFNQKEDQILDLIPISISHDNIDFEGIKWESNVTFKKEQNDN